MTRQLGSGVHRWTSKVDVQEETRVENQKFLDVAIRVFGLDLRTTPYPSTTQVFFFKKKREDDEERCGKM